MVGGLLTSLDALFAQRDEALLRMLSVDPGELSDGEVHRGLLAVGEELCSLQAVEAKLAAEWSNRGIWAEDGSRHPGARLARELSCRKASGYRVIHRARALVEMPRVLVALEEARINVDHVAMLAAANTPRRRDLFVRDEEMLVGFCVHLEYWEAERAIEVWKLRADAELGDDGPAPRWHNRQARSYRGVGNEVHLEAIFDAVGGAMFMAVWDRIDNELRLDDQRRLAETGEIPRTRQQRRLDALVEMAIRAASYTDNDTDSDSPGPDSEATDAAPADNDTDADEVGAEVEFEDVEDVEADTEVADDDGEDVDDASGDVSGDDTPKNGGSTGSGGRLPCGCRRSRPRPLVTVVLGDESFRRLCELSDGTVIAPGELVPYLADLDLNTILFDGPWRAIAGSNTRTFGGLLRRAIEVRDRRCRHPAGDGAPINRCDVDHIVPKARGGITCQCNGRLMESGLNRDESRRNLTADDITINRDDPSYRAARARIDALIAQRRAPPTSS